MSASVPTAAAVLQHIVTSLVDNPDDVSVDEVTDGEKTRLDVRVAPGDLGRVIGRHGRTAASIRTITRAAATKDTSDDINIEFLD